MLQLINALPFSEEAHSRLREDWNRFLDGFVTMAECSDAIRGEFECEAEVINENEAAVASTVDQDGNLVSEKSALLPSGKGKLILTCSKLYWMMENEGRTVGWSVDYQNLILHAITTQSDRPCVYLQLNYTKMCDDSGKEIHFHSNDAEEDEADEDEKFVEINLFLDAVKTADELFVALSECAALHPDDEDESDDEDAGFTVADIVADINDDIAGTDGITDSKKKSKLNENFDNEKRFEDAGEN